MAIFKKTTKEVTKKASAPKAVKAKKTENSRASKDTVRRDFAKSNRVNAIVRPHITEKAAILAEKGTYVFEVARDTNKIEIAKAIEALYKVTPARVNIINLPNTRVFVRGKNGVKSGIRKALVTLKKGDKIELI